MAAAAESRPFFALEVYNINRNMQTARICGGDKKKKNLFIVSFLLEASLVFWQ